MRFTDTFALWIIPVVLVFFPTLFLLAGRRRSKLLGQVLGSRVNEDGAVNFSLARRRLRYVLLIALMVLLCVVWARPYWSVMLTPELPRGRDIMVLFDVSRSMLSDDVAPSRLEHGKYLVRELIKHQKEDRFGLAAFAGASYLSCPLTGNKSAFNEYVNELDCELVPVGGTDIAGALRRAVAAFKAAEGNHRAVVLITDGDELTGSAEKEIKKLKSRNTPIYVVGVGETAGVPVRGRDGGIVRTRDGKVAMTRLNEELLAAIAKESGGAYIRSTATDPGVDKLLTYLDRLDRKEREGIKRTLPVDKFPGFIAAALFIYFIYMMIPERGQAVRKSSRIALIILFFVISPSLSGAEPEAEKPQSDEKMTVYDAYNAARDRQSKGEDASELYAKTLHLAENFERIQAKTHFNLAVQSHSQAEQDISAAEKAISAQDLQTASNKLAEAEKQLAQSSAVYKNAYSIDSGNYRLPADNLTALALDRKKVEELKKKIEELKKQQQKAQQDARNARQQNRQNAGNSQQQSAMDQARESAGKLEQQAKELGQKELEKKAKEAKESLEKAKKSQAQNRDQETKKHLDDAVKALSGNEKEKKPKNDGKQDKSDGKSDGKQEQPKPEKLDRQPQNQGKSGSPDQERKIDPRSAEQLLDMLKKDEQQRRNELKRRSRGRRINVEKDW